MPRNEPSPPDSDEVFRSFVRELATGSQPGLMDRLTLGHEPDAHGWCRHPGHEYHWERHPCTAVRLASLVEDEGDSSPDGVRPRGRPPSPR